MKRSPVRVPPAEHVELDLTSALLERGGRGHRSRRQRRLEALELLEVRLGLLEVRLEAGLHLRIAGAHDVVFQLLDLGRKQRGDLLLDEGIPPRPASGRVRFSRVRWVATTSRPGLPSA